MSHTTRGFAAEKVFIDCWKDTGFKFNRNPRSDRIKKMLNGVKAEPDLVEQLQLFVHKLVEHASSLGHETAHEAPSGFRLSTDDPDVEDAILRIHLNNDWVSHPRPSPSSPPTLWFGYKNARSWHENTRKLWGGEDGGLFKKYQKEGFKTWTALRAHDKQATIELITLMRDAIHAECVALSSKDISAFIEYLDLNQGTLHVTLDTAKNVVSSSTYGAQPDGDVVTSTREGHDRIVLTCGKWTFKLRVHNADKALKDSSFKVEIEVPEHP